MDVLDLRGIVWQRAIIHNTRGKPRLMNCKMKRQATAHGPTERANMLCVNVRTGSQMVECRFHIYYCALLAKSAT